MDLSALFSRGLAAPIHETTFHCGPLWKSCIPSKPIEPALMFSNARILAILEHGRKPQVKNRLEQGTAHHFCVKAKKYRQTSASPPLQTIPSQVQP